MRKNMLIVGAIVAGVLLGSVGPGMQAMGQAATMPGERGGGERGGQFAELFKGLDLTAEQKPKLKEVVEGYLKQLKEWRSAHLTDLEKVRTDFKAARAAGDQEKLKEIAAELKSLLEDAPKPKEMLDKLKDILTPEQMAKVQKRLDALKERVRERREEGTGATSQPANT